MVSYTQADVAAHLLRLEWPKKTASTGDDKEIVLHQSIKDYCNSQWPKWKYINARSDRRSTIAVGAHDFSIFLPHGRVLCIECKTKTGKLSVEQSGWKLEMAMLGHTVHVVRSMAEFVALL